MLVRPPLKEALAADRGRAVTRRSVTARAASRDREREWDIASPRERVEMCRTDWPRVMSGSPTRSMWNHAQREHGPAVPSASTSFSEMDAMAIALADSLPAQ